MSSVRKNQPAALNPHPQPERAAAPQFVPRPKHPLALACSAAVLVAWIAFLVAMAIRG